MFSSLASEYSKILFSLNTRPAAVIASGYIAFLIFLFEVSIFVCFGDSFSSREIPFIGWFFSSSKIRWTDISHTLGVDVESLRAVKSDPYELYEITTNISKFPPDILMK